MTLITLTTDFGLADGYVGTLKGVILGIAPDARLIDLSHDVLPQNIRQAAHILAGAAPFFPAGAVHLVVVDPGVGSARRPLLVSTPDAYFVGPDNGLFTFALAAPGAQAWVLDRPQFWLPQVSRTFHGRDIFAPIAAHLALGAPPHLLATPIPDPVRLQTTGAERLGNGTIHGHVSHVDRFGNLITDIPAAWVANGRWMCEIAGRQITGISATYAEAAPGALITLISSGGAVEIAVCNGSAAQCLDARPDDPVRLWAAP